MMPKVVVIILNINQKDNTLNCLRSLHRIDYENCEIVLVDNGSSDGSVDAVSYLFPNVVIIALDRNMGAAGGRNIGIDYTNKNFEYDYLLFLDNDTVVEKKFLSMLVEYSEKDESVGIAFPPILYLTDKSVFQWAGNIKMNFYTGVLSSEGHGKKDVDRFNQLKYSMLAISCCCLVKKKVIDKVIGFDEIYDPYGFEDIDFALRARYEGYRCLYIPYSRIYHKSSRTPSSGEYNRVFTELKGRNMKYFIKRHATSFQYLCFLCCAPILGFRTLIREMRRGNAQAAFSLFKSFLAS